MEGPSGNDQTCDNFAIGAFLLDQPDNGISTAYNPFLVLVADHLTSPTRRQRKALLATVATSLIVCWTKVTPEGIPSLGISQKLDPKIVLGFLACVDFYFLLTFVVYWLADYWTWELNLRRSIDSLQETKEGFLSLDEAIQLAMRTSVGISTHGNGSGG